MLNLKQHHLKQNLLINGPFSLLGFQKRDIHNSTLQQISKVTSKSLVVVQ